MKKFLAIAAIALALTACELEVDEDKEVIAVSGVTDVSTTSATSTTSTTTVPETDEWSDTETANFYADLSFLLDGGVAVNDALTIISSPGRDPYEIYGACEDYSTTTWLIYDRSLELWESTPVGSLEEEIAWLTVLTFQAYGNALDACAVADLEGFIDFMDESDFYLDAATRLMTDLLNTIA